MIFVFLPTHNSCALRLSGRAEQSSAFIGALSGMAGEMNCLSTSRPKNPQPCNHDLMHNVRQFLMPESREREENGSCASAFTELCASRSSHFPRHDDRPQVSLRAPRGSPFLSIISRQRSKNGELHRSPSQRRRWRCGIASALREAMESSKIRR